MSPVAERHSLRNPRASLDWYELGTRPTSKPDRAIPADTKTNIMTCYKAMAIADNPHPKPDEHLATPRMMKTSD